MTCLHSMHCNIYGNMDSSNLQFLGFSYASPPAPEPSLMLPGDATMVEIEASDIPPNRLHDKQRQLASSRANSEGKLTTVLDYFPNPRQSFFFTFVVTGANLDKVSMDVYEPMYVDSISPECAVLFPDGGRCITGTVDGCLVEWDVTTQEILRCFYDSSIGKRQERGGGRKARLAHEGSVSCMSVQDDVLASGGMEGVVKVWAASSGKLTSTLKLFHDMVS